MKDYKKIPSEKEIEKLESGFLSMNNHKIKKLHNELKSVIKITNAANGKSVYAKVLDLIPDIKQNTGLIIRLSNAAADALGTSENKLDCTLNYSK